MSVRLFANVPLGAAVTQRGLIPSRNQRQSRKRLGIAADAPEERDISASASLTEAETLWFLLHRSILFDLILLGIWIRVSWNLVFAYVFTLGLTR